MASTNKTTNYQLSQFQSSDIPAWLTDYNGDMQKIDAGIHAAKVQADGAASGVSILQTTVSGKQDRLDFDASPIAGSTNPVTSGGIYNALQNAQIQTDAVPTEGSTKAVQSGGVYTALQGKQNSLNGANAFGNFTMVTAGGSSEAPLLRYFYTPSMRLFLAFYADGHQLSLYGSRWSTVTDAQFPSYQRLFEISGNPFNLISNPTFPVTQSGLMSLKAIDLGGDTILNSNEANTGVYFNLAYIEDENKTVIYAQANYPKANNQTVRTTLMGDLSFAGV